MIGKHKKFSKKLYKKFDAPAKQAMRKHLEQEGHTVTVPPENYGVDLYSELGPLVMYHEVEVFRNWKTGGFPFLTGSIPSRKLRLLEMIGRDVPLYFWRLRRDLQRALVYGSYCLKDKFLVEVPNKEVESGEYFYRVPVMLGKEFDLKPITHTEVF